MRCVRRPRFVVGLLSFRPSTQQRWGQSVIGFLTFAQVQPSIVRCVDQVKDIKATAKSKGTIDKVAITFTKNNTCNGAKITVNAVDGAGHTGTGSAILELGASGRDQIAINGDVDPRRAPSTPVITWEVLA